MGRILLTIVSTALIALGTLYIQATVLSQQALSEQANQKLTAISSSRSAELGRYLQLLQSELQLYASSPMTSDALKAFSAAYANEETPQQSLQYAYIDNNPFPPELYHQFFRAPGPESYHAAHEAFHGYLRLWLELGELYDVFLIDAQGNLVYSVVKERDFATNLFNGPWKDSGLADIARTLTNNKIAGSLAVADFDSYGPSKGAPASFIGMPVFDDGAFIGSLAIQLPITAIEAILSEYDGLGKTGEVYIVGSGETMLSNSRFTETSTILRQKVHTKSAELALSGNSGIHHINNYLETPVLSSFQPFQPFPSANNPVTWALIAEINDNEVEQPTQILLRRITLLGALVLIGAALVGTWEARAISKPIKQMQVALTLLANGENTDIPGKQRKDEIGKMALAAEEFRLQNQVVKNRQAQQTRIAQLTQLVSSDIGFNDALDEILRFFCEAFDIPMAAFYKAEDQQLHLTASRGINRQSAPPLKVAFSDSLAGQALIEKRVINISPVPDNHLELSAGMASGKLEQISFYPIRHIDLDVAVMELGYCRQISEQEDYDLTELSSYLGLLLSNLKANQDNKQLLVESQALTKDLQRQQDELNTANAELLTNTEELKAQTEELRAKEEELKRNNQSLFDQQKSLKAARKDAEEKAKALAQASQYKSEFLANMSHELRTPLNSILILAKDLAEQVTLSEEQIESAEVIYESGSSLLQLINDILDLSKIEAGKLTTHIEAFDPAKVCSYLSNIFQPLAQKRGNEFLIETPDSLQTLHSDAQRVQQVLTNLVSNAIKFTEQGTVRLAISQDDEGLTAMVSDTGIGIEADKLDHIFGAFQQEDGSTSRRFGGTGLGLAISKQLAKMLGGDIVVESTPGEGSAFTVYFANQRQNTIQASKPETSSTASKPSAPKPSMLSGHILLVEDDAPLAKVMSQKLDSMGNQVQHVESAEQALSYIQQKRPQAILLDIGLPGMSGIDLLEIIKKDPDLKEIPICMMSGMDDSGETKTLGAMGYLQKPVNHEVLGSTVQAMLLSKRVLLLEDNPQISLTVEALLKREDICCTTFAAGAEGLEALATQNYAALILDLNLEDMDGVTFVEQAKAQQIFVPPTIIFSADDIPKEQYLTLREFSDSFVLKTPEGMHRLKDELLNIIEQSPATKATNVSASACKKILLVDDDMRNLFALSKVLKQRGHDVTLADSGHKALELLSSEQLDIIITDIMMPEMDGYELMKQIRSQYSQTIPIIALTAKAMPGDAQLCIDAGANDYLSKPVDVDKLEQAIYEC